MKRRQAIQAILGTPVLTALPAASATSPESQQPDETAKLATVVGEAAGDPVRKFFTPQQHAALRKLGDLLVPPGEHRAGASQAQAAEFLDFLISQSARSRQVLYSNGLDRLQLESGRRYNHRFEDLTVEQADSLLVPLREPWTWHGPTDSFARFLHAAKEDLMAATSASREYAAVQSAAGRRASGMGTYWYAIE